ncbi:unnamed protein product [Lactuca virosa]|uniref:Uncharacterized protein n=1 Tax=Lactuca virosa TaxID=75947 RepID=A0AAU9PR75_9ASTR|nr:unnamed protein product [Lactuca virosa]
MDVWWGGEQWFKEGGNALIKITLLLPPPSPPLFTPTKTPFPHHLYHRSSSFQAHTTLRQRTLNLISKNKIGGS